MSNRSNNQDTELFYVLLKALNVKYTKQFSHKLYNEHAHKTNMFGLSKMLTEYGIDNEGLRFEDKDEITSLNVPFVAQLHQDLVVVLKLTDSSVVYYQRGKEKELPPEEFKEKWSGVALAIDPDTKAVEPEYKENKRKELYKAILKYTLIGCICAILISVVINKRYYQDIGMILVLAVNLLGAYIGYLLMLKQVKVHSASADKICSALKQGDCNNVLESKAAKLWGIIGWSEAGLGYFISNLIIIMFFPNLMPYLALINIGALPYSVWSIWYQKVKAKQWCALCLIVQVAFYLLFAVNLIFGYITWPEFTPGQVVSAAIIYLIPFVMISLFTPAIAESLKVSEIIHKMNNLKMMDEVFEGLLKNSDYYEVDESVSQIVFGNPDAEMQITVISNPHCEPCGKAHEQLDKLMDTLGDRACIRFVFINFKSENFNNSGKFLISAYLNSDEQTAKDIYYKWFTGEKYKVHKTYEQYGFDMEAEEVVRLQERHEQWSKENNIPSTPTILINGYKLYRQVYNIEDLNLI